jgi:preprotein translocase subunit YajC
MKEKILSVALLIILIVILFILIWCSNDKSVENEKLNETTNNVENNEVINTSNTNTTQIEDVTDTTNNIESSSYNLDGDFIGIHKQDSLTSNISIQGNNITWLSAGVELTGTFVIEDNNLKATWNDGKSSTLTIVSDEQLKGSEPFSSSGEIVIFNKK